jgi:hypothetical protein
MNFKSWLSLVVIFTQSIQLSKIVRDRYCDAVHSGVNSSSWLKVQDSAVVAEVLNIEQVSLNVTLREFGGADRDRTDDILLAKQALSQLSYSPNMVQFYMNRRKWWAWIDSNYRPHPYQGCALAN